MTGITSSAQLELPELWRNRNRDSLSTFLPREENSTSSRRRMELASPRYVLVIRNRYTRFARTSDHRFCDDLESLTYSVYRTFNFCIALASLIEWLRTAAWSWRPTAWLSSACGPVPWKRSSSSRTRQSGKLAVEQPIRCRRRHWIMAEIPLSGICSPMGRPSSTAANASWHWLTVSFFSSFSCIIWRGSQYCTIH